jgi:hypothetical protein
MFNFCKHKYGEVKGKYQYCTICGKAISVAVSECKHNYILLDQARVKGYDTELTVELVFISRCSKCGHIKEDRIEF